MTREAEAEAWVRRGRRAVHNQFFIQALAVLAIVVPLPLVATIFWAVFGLASPMIIQGIVVLWAAATIAYAALFVYTRIRQGKL
jgi:uncharacterized RDD family membrane protein YckC